MNRTFAGAQHMRTYPNFLWLCVGQLISLVGDTLFDVALMVAIFQSTASAIATGCVLIVVTAGRLVGAIPAVNLVGTFSARSIMLWSDVLRAAVILILTMANAAHAVAPLPAMYLCTFLVSVIGASFEPARSSAIPAIVPPESCLPANAFDGLLVTIVSCVAWGISGIVVSRVGATPSLILDAVSFGLSWLCVRRATWTETRPDVSVRQLLSRASCRIGGCKLGVGWNHVARVMFSLLGSSQRDFKRVTCAPSVASLFSVHGAQALLNGVLVTSLMPFISHHLANPAVYGFQGASLGAGAAFGFLLVKRLVGRDLKRLWWGGLLLMGAGNTLFALSTPDHVLLAGSFLAGLGSAIQGSSKTTLLQHATAADWRGRCFAVWNVVAQAALLLGILAGSVAVSLLDSQLVLVAASLGCVLLGLWVRRLSIIGAVAQVEQVIVGATAVGIQFIHAPSTRGVSFLRIRDWCVASAHRARIVSGGTSTTSFMTLPTLTRQERRRHRGLLRLYWPDLPLPRINVTICSSSD